MKYTEAQRILEKFISQNEVSTYFKSKSASNRNYSIVVLVGFSIYKDIPIQHVEKYLSDNYMIPTKEIKPVYKSASKNDYGKFWTTEEAKLMYRF